ncbi:hypothetical protein AAC387_Pa05g0433 [Persea americana]
MSSSSSVRRIKERGGAGGKVTALKPHKTLTENHRPKDALGSAKKPAGKENPRPASGAGTPSSCQKPAIRRTEKAAAGPGKDGGSAVRWSTASAPKGKISNPSDFSRILLDLRSGRVSRVSGPDRVLKPLGRGSVETSFPVIEKCQLKKSSSISHAKGQDDRSVSCLKGSDNSRALGLNSKEMIVGNATKVLEDCKEQSSENGKFPSSSSEKDAFFGAMGAVKNRDLHLDLNALEEKPLNGIRVLKNCSENGYLGSDAQGSGANAAKNIRIAENSRDKVLSDLNLVERGEKSSDDFGKLGVSEKEDVGDKNKGGQVAKKYRSTLHEKLAYLEGKVKRIASDIKKTKDMLDMNDPDASKMILLDIQDKISGIEKAMGHPEDDGKGKLVSSETDKLQRTNPEKSEDGLTGSLKNSVKSLNHEELEARLFPHHKLLRNRPSLGNSAGKEEILGPNFPEASGSSVREEESLSPIDENPIALEFLASLNQKHPAINSDSRHCQLQCAPIQEMDDNKAAKQEAGVSKKVVSRMQDDDIGLMADENLEDFDDQENSFSMVGREQTEDSSAEQLREIGRKSSTGGWFVSDGESVLLAHDDSSCSFYDVTNSEEKSIYMPPSGVSHNLWGDCWLIRAADSDGCSGRYVVAASAGSTLDSGFCSWDFYTKAIRAFRVEDGITTTSRTVLGPLPNRVPYRRDTLSTTLAPGNQQWWYKPSGPLLVATASGQKVVSMYDIRDSDLIMKWEVQRPILAMDYSSPLQWRNKGKVVIAEAEAISLWDVNTLNPQSALSIASFGRKVTALHINNTEAELGGGVRRRVSSSEAEGNDGVFCTRETINVLDFRLQSGVGLKITKPGINCHSIFSHRDSIFLGSTEVGSAARELSRSLVQHFSLRKGQLVSTYALPASNAHFHHSSITQVWGDSNFVMAICGMGLFVFDSFNEAQPLPVCHEGTSEVREIIGPDDLYCPSFDYSGSRVLLISRDRPAHWKYLS